MQTSTLIAIAFSFLASAGLAALERQLMPEPGPVDSAAVAALVTPEDGLHVVEFDLPARSASRPGWQNRTQRPLYEFPQLRLPPIRLLLAPRSLRVLSLSGCWAQVRLADGTTGWMLRDDLRAAPAPVLAHQRPDLARPATAI